MLSPSPNFLAAPPDSRTDFSQGIAAPDKLRRDANTPLSIAVIGQFCSGKSGFLKALLFDGASLLPKAATPGTVHLTRIVHGERPKLTVHYYTPEDWAALERLTASSATGMEAGVARELTKLAQRADIDIAACLARRTETVEAGTLDELLGSINDYVNIKGSYNALVESVEFALPLDALCGIEVVDTPSINDPVISRTQKARDYLARCDVVFFLSWSGQFLDKIDMELISAQLPSKGVKRLILVATHFGGAVGDDYICHSSLTVAEHSIKERLTHRSHEMLERIAAQREQSGYTDLAALLRASATPLFMCSHAHGFATQPPEHWDRFQRMRYQNFVYQAEYAWGGYLPTPADWQRLAGFEALHDAFAAARADKGA
jgi:hypothetical protein